MGEILCYQVFGGCSVDRNQFLVKIRLPMFAAVAFLTIANTATAIAKPNSKVLTAAKACEPSARSLLQQLVQRPEPVVAASCSLRTWTRCLRTAL